MKKILTVSLFAALALGAFADYTFPGFTKKDPALYAASAAQAKTPVVKCRDLVLKSMLEKPVKSWDDFCATVDVVVEANKGNLNEAGVAFAKRFIRKHLGTQMKLYPKELWAYCKSNPGWYDFVFVQNCYKSVMTDAEAYAWVLDYILKQKKADPKLAKRAVAFLVEVGPNLSNNTDVKADLQRLNRIYSKNLLEDKAKWEPVVALIRTALETY